MTCQVCGVRDAEGWSVEIDGKILEDGCLECFEDHAGERFWVHAGLLEQQERQRDIIIAVTIGIAAMAFIGALMFILQGVGG